MIITAEENFQIPGTDILIEKGDRIVVREATILHLYQVVGTFLGFQPALSVDFDNSAKTMIIYHRGFPNNPIRIKEYNGEFTLAYESPRVKVNFEFEKIGDLVSWIIQGNIATKLGWPIVF